MTTDKNLLIKVEGLEKSFGKIEVLKGIDTEINKGDVVVVIGPSGSGKSTFLRTPVSYTHLTLPTILRV